MGNRKIALVTGASGGLGTHVTKALLDVGATVDGLSPNIKQSAFDHQNFTALPASLSSLDAAKKAENTVHHPFAKIDSLAHLFRRFACAHTISNTDDAT